MTNDLQIEYKDIQRECYGGIGKPEALKNNLRGWWSKRIDDVN